MSMPQCQYEKYEHATTYVSSGTCRRTMLDHTTWLFACDSYVNVNGYALGSASLITL